MKKKFVGFIISLMLVITVFATSVSANWPMFGYTPTNTRSSDSSAPETNNVIWTYYNQNYEDSSPAIVDNKVYFGRGIRLDCVDAITGDLIYTTDGLGGTTHSSPAVANGKVYIGSAENTKLNCLDAVNGDLLWDFSTGVNLYNSPTVAYGKVFICSGGILFCLNAETGEELWELSMSIDGIPAIDGDYLYAGSMDDGSFYCLNVTDGSTIWSYAFDPLSGFASPTVVNGKILFGIAGFAIPWKFVCLNTDGSFSWEYILGDDLPSKMAAVSNGKVCFGSGGYWPDYFGSIRCIDIETGNLDWTYTTGGSVTSPAIADGKVYAGSKDNNIYCLDLNDGSIIWNYTVNDDILSSPAISDGKLFVGASDGTMYCFRQNNGPAIPDTPSGPTEGVTGVEYDFETSTTDPNDDQVFYMFDWGDGEMSDWIGPYDSGVATTGSHIWTEGGEYEIKVKAKDVYNIESDWSQAATIEILDLQPELSVEIQTGFGVGASVVIQNIGDAVATSVNYNFVITGGILGKINVSISGLLASIEPGAEEVIDSGTFFGLGPIELNADSTCSEGSSDNDAKTGLQLIVFTLVQ